MTTQCTGNPQADLLRRRLLNSCSLISELWFRGYTVGRAKDSMRLCHTEKMGLRFCKGLPHYRWSQPVFPAWHLCKSWTNKQDGCQKHSPPGSPKDDLRIAHSVHLCGDDPRKSPRACLCCVELRQGDDVRTAGQQLKTLLIPSDTQILCNTLTLQ